jgi:hypothetical protein
MKNWMGWVVVAGVVVSCLGCVIPAGNARVNSSHFVYPNSNVTAGHKSEGSVTRLCGILIFSWNGFTPTATETAYLRAIQKQSNGDLLINASESRTQIILPLPILPLFQLCNTSVEGTVASMEVGKQELR